MEFKYNKFTLAFSDSETEKRFHESYRESSLFQIRLAMVAGFMLYALFGFLDAALVPEQKQILWFIRYAIVCPLIAGLFLFSFTNVFKRCLQASINIMIIVAGMGIIVMIAVAPPPANYSYYAGLILVFMYIYTFIKSRFIWATITGWIIVILYEFTAIWILPTPIPILINNNFFFISANLTGMFACYFIEYSARRDFFLVQQLDTEREKVKNANVNLEKRVEERTAALKKSLVKLELEISERIKTEDEKKELENDLKQSEKMRALGQLAGGIAHDFNNILAGIVGSVQVLSLKPDDIEKVKKYSNSIYDMAMEAADLNKNLLAFSRKGKIQSISVDVHDCISKTLSILRHAIDKRIGLHKDLKAQNRRITGDPSQISNALLNLGLNARDAMPDGGKLEILTNNLVLNEKFCRESVFEIEPGDFIEVCIRDNGIGMTKETIRKIYEPFFTTKGIGKGTGLGLAAVYGIIKDHIGAIQVLSEPGKGSVFKIYLPNEKTVDVHTSEDSEIFSQGEGVILLIDDEYIIRETNREMLEDLGYTVILAQDGEEGVEKFMENADSVDLVLLDMVMPKKNGYDTFKAMRAINPMLKVVVMSGFFRSEGVNELIQEGACDFLQKPVQFEKLVKTLEEHLK